MKTYGVAETKYQAVDTLCHVARNASNVLAVKSLCGISLPWILGDYEATPAGWSLCQRCQESTRQGGTHA
jgi:hypothetical protein